MTPFKAHSFKEFSVKLKAAVGRDAPSVSVAWVKMLNPRIQRLFGWGDVAASAADVKHAVDEAQVTGDTQEVVALIPHAAQLLERPGQDTDDVLALLPDFANALAGNMSMLVDCQHCFDDSVPYLPGPCTRRGCHENRVAAARHGFESCTSCHAVYCCVCVAEAAEKVTHDNDVSRLLHDARGEHTWSHGTWRDRCTICCNNDAMVCACGARHCEKCQARPKKHVPGTPISQWKQDQYVPLPCYVVVPKQVEIDEKAAYIKQMIGPHASLAEVASMYLQLYAATNRDKAKQKSSAIEAWKLYSGEDFGKKIQNIPFPERTEFPRVWDASLPDRCCIF